VWAWRAFAAGASIVHEMKVQVFLAVRAVHSLAGRGAGELSNSFVARVALSSGRLGSVSSGPSSGSSGGAVGRRSEGEVEHHELGVING